MDKNNTIKIIIAAIAFIINSFLTLLRTGDDKIDYFIITIVIAISYIMIAFDLNMFFFSKNGKQGAQSLSYMPCEYDPMRECCVNNYIKVLKDSGKVKHMMLSKELLDKYKLISEFEMNEKEREFGNSKTANRQIWVFSYDLSTEVLGDDSQNIVKQNLQKGIKYYEFVLYNEETRPTVDTNINILMRSLTEKSRKNIIIKHLEEDNNVNILPYLLGSIIFINGDYQQSYFSLRGDEFGKTNPIYFKMPNCMNKKYYKYFQSKINNK